MTDRSAPTRGEVVIITRADIALARKLVAQFQDDDFDCERISHEVAAHRLAAIEEVLTVVEPLLRFHESGAHEGDGSDYRINLIRNLGRGA